LIALFGLWLHENIRWIQERHETLEIISEFSDIVRDGNNNVPPSAPWAIRLLGEPGITEIWIHPPFDMATASGEAAVSWGSRDARDAAAKRAERLFPEARIVRDWRPLGGTASGGGFF